MFIYVYLTYSWQMKSVIKKADKFLYISYNTELDEIMHVNSTLIN